MLNYRPMFFGSNARPHLITPLVYDDSLSYIEQIARLRAVIECVYEYVKNLDEEIQKEFENVYKKFDEYVTKVEFELSQKNQTKELKDYTDYEIAELKKYTEELVANIIIGKVLVFDPSTGFISPINDALSHLYNDLRYYAATWDEIDAYLSATTWDAWDVVCQTHTVKEFDLLFASLFLDADKPRAKTLPQDYIKEG